MSLSPESSAALDHLIFVTHDLLAEMTITANLYAPAMLSSWASAAETVQRYLAILAKDRSTNDAALALRGANLLTTSNRGVSDLKTPPTNPQINEKAFAVSRAAINAAKHLRSDVGLGF